MDAMPTPPGDDPAFLRPILDAYARDGPRLVWADFLSDSGRPADAARAALVRVQVALARLGPDHPRRAELVARQDDLLAAHRSDWAGPYAGLVAGVEFRRGLADAVSVDTAVFLDRADDLFARGPVRRVRLLDARPHLHRLAGSPALARVRELDLCGNDLGDAGVGLIAESPYLANLELLDLSFTGITDTGAVALARSANLPGLRRLSLTDNGRIGNAGLAALVGGPLRHRLTGLDVSGNDIDADGIRAVVAGRDLARLRTLDVHTNPLGDDGVAVLARSALFARMVARRGRVDLRRNGIGPAGAAALGSAPAMAAATGLDLSGNDLGDAGLSAIGFAAGPARLRRLAVRQNGITDDGAIALAHSPLMRRLRAVDLADNRLTRKGLDELFARRADWQVTVDAAGNFASDDPFPHSGVAFVDARPATRREVARVLRRLAPGEKPGRE